MAPSGHWQSLPHSPARLVSLTTMFIGVHGASPSDGSDVGGSDGGSDGGSGGGDGGGVATQCQRIAASMPAAWEATIFTPTQTLGNLRKYAQDSALAFPPCKRLTAQPQPVHVAHLNRVFVCLTRPFVSGGEKALDEPKLVCLRACVYVRASRLNSKPVRHDQPLQE